jgi:hypothetical protein
MIMQEAILEQAPPDAPFGNKALDSESGIGRLEEGGSDQRAGSGGASKKEQILELYHQGISDIAEIAHVVDVRPSYAAQILQQAGLVSGYFDLYTSTSAEQNVYSRLFRNVLAFKTIDAAKESLRRIDRLYNYFERIGDRAGQHHAMVLALTGKNRARWSGKHEAAKIFSDWLATH